MIAGRIDSLLEQIEILETSNIELRFGELDYALIAKLQKDHRVDQRQTPQTGASIKIVLGTVNYLANHSVDRMSVRPTEKTSIVPINYPTKRCHGN